MEWPDYVKELSRIELLAPEQERKLWADFKERGGREARSCLIRAYQPLVFRCAKPFADLGEIMDVVQEGIVGLIEAAESYDHRRGVAFSLFAIHRIRGRMMDWLAAKAKGDALAMDFSALAGERCRWEAIPDTGSDVSARLELAELHDRLQNAVSRLPEKERRVISSLYMEDEKAADVAADMDLSVGSVYRLQKKAIRRIRGMLSRFMAK